MPRIIFIFYGSQRPEPSVTVVTAGIPQETNTSELFIIKTEKGDINPPGFQEVSTLVKRGKAGSLIIY
jgi:hypothetical protein